MNLEEFKKEIDSTPKWKLAYWAARRFVLAPLDWPDEVKYFIQRGVRGYSNRDCWGINFYIMEWLPKALRQLAENKQGCPQEFFDDDAPDGDECIRWTTLLNDMATKIEAVSKWENSNHDDFLTGEQHWKEYKRLGELADKKTNEGLELFKKYFHNLWD